MDIKITPAPLSGVVNAIPSKSYAHRYLISAALSSSGESVVNIGVFSRDIEATVQCLCELGAEIRNENGICYIKPISDIKKLPVLHCGESGSTLRFLVPVAAALGGAKFKMEGRLAQRPMDELLESMSSHGVSFKRENDTLTVSGGMTGCEFKIVGNVSSQYISGLLFALPLCGGGRVTLLSELESAPYVYITRYAMSEFGVNVIIDENGFRVDRDSHYLAANKKVQGDWSNAAFWLACGVGVKGLDWETLQGDMAILDVLHKMGAEINYTNDITCPGVNDLRGCDIDASDIPDLVPILSILASRAKGVTVINNIQRLRIKESDRVETVCNMLCAFGINHRQSENSLVIYGSDKPFNSCNIDCANDHRIAMSAAIGAIYAKGEVTLVGAEAVNKSYPAFFEDYKKLGGIINV